MREAEVTVDEVYTTQTALHNCLEPHGCVATWEGDAAHAVGLHPVHLRGAPAGGAEAGPARAPRAGDQAVHGRGLRQQADRLEAHRHRRPPLPRGRAAGAADARPRGGEPGRRQPQRHPPARPPRRPAGRHPDRHRRPRSSRRRARTWSAARGAASDGPYQRLYRCPNVRTEQQPVYTNTGPAVAFRAPGHVEGAFALESAMDELARALRARSGRAAPAQLRRGRPETGQALHHSRRPCASATSGPPRLSAGRATERPAAGSGSEAARGSASPPTTGEGAGIPRGTPGSSSTRTARRTWSPAPRTSAPAPAPP